MQPSDARSGKWRASNICQAIIPGDADRDPRRCRNPFTDVLDSGAFCGVHAHAIRRRVFKDLKERSRGRK